MKITDDGKCPYCSSQVSEKPGKAVKNISCSTCGRILTLPKAGAEKRIYEVDGIKTLEPALLFSFFISLAVAINSTFLIFLFAALGVGFMLQLFLNGVPSFLPDKLGQRASGTVARLKVFPFELYLIPFWVLILLSHMTHEWTLKGILVSLSMVLSAVMALQANRLYMDKRIRTTDVSWKDFMMFYNILLDPVTAFEKRGADLSSDGDQATVERFSQAAVERQEIDKLQQQIDEEMERKRELCVAERRRWEEDLHNRYDGWLEEESSRLLSEK
jgi:ribosomal protein S27E